MELLRDFSADELAEILRAAGQPPFRAAQIYNWVNNGADYDAMNDVPKSLREYLKARYRAAPPRIAERLVSKDGSQKYLFVFDDGEAVEGVFMPHGYGNTLCASVQAGCRMGCAFCASGKNGLSRNLSAGEILGQVIAVNALLGGSARSRKIQNIVLMGSGEPLDNYDNTVKFLRLVTDARGLNFSSRAISLSTSGLVPEIRRLADEGAGVTLSVSLHATTDESRQKIMPIAKKYPISELLAAAKYYFEKTGRRVIFEYSLMKEYNMNFFDAKRLAEFCKNLSAHVNLIMLNRIDGGGIGGCTKPEAERFLEKLTRLGVSATLRRSFGSDIGGACGQLRGNYKKTEKQPKTDV
ncbi:MAG: 23S rRNA (adenine(2503)-C(2))-methyltransferase RlmN [Clostridiales bacterium]|jgi:23S rRNA (adenine2503-C2)-methyltransferase|nr:23S rRNA (adenine(2503)-C(2))-methyltransferase RlmN [Clostridiales bacterium]